MRRDRQSSLTKYDEDGTVTVLVIISTVTMRVECCLSVWDADVTMIDVVGLTNSVT